MIRRALTGRSGIALWGVAWNWTGLWLIPLSATVHLLVQVAVGLCANALGFGIQDPVHLFLGASVGAVFAVGAQCVEAVANVPLGITAGGGVAALVTSLVWLFEGSYLRRKRYVPVAAEDLPGPSDSPPSYGVLRGNTPAGRSFAGMRHVVLDNSLWSDWDGEVRMAVYLHEIQHITNGDALGRLIVAVAWWPSMVIRRFCVESLGSHRALSAVVRGATWPVHAMLWVAEPWLGAGAGERETRADAAADLAGLASALSRYREFESAVAR